MVKQKGQIISIVGKNMKPLEFSQKASGSETWRMHFGKVKVKVAYSLSDSLQPPWTIQSMEFSRLEY